MSALGERELEFLARTNSAAMITVGADGFAKATRVGVAAVDGKVWSSGTRDRARTKRLRRNPQATLFVFDSQFAYMTLEALVTILEGDDAPDRNLRLFRLMQNKPDGPLSWFGGTLEESDFLRTMRDEGRVIYEFEIQRAYGLY
jgi:uncharacterized pyridoxamine 5'-phosphate oxidase family protein